MNLWWLFITGALVFGLLPFAMLPPAAAIGELYWTVPAGVVSVAAAFKSFAFFEEHGIEGPGGSSEEEIPNHE